MASYLVAEKLFWQQKGYVPDHLPTTICHDNYHDRPLTTEEKEEINKEVPDFSKLESLRAKIAKWDQESKG